MTQVDTGTPTREKIVVAALALMRSKGYHATSVDEICERAAVSKGSFYHFFKTKEEVGIAAMDESMEQARRLVGDADYASIVDPKERALAFLEHLEVVAEQVWGHGCIVGSFAMEVMDTTPALASEVSRWLAGATDSYAEMLDAAGNEARGGQTARELAEHLLAVIEGAIVLGKASGDWTVLPRTIRSFREYAESRIG